MIPEWRMVWELLKIDGPFFEAPDYKPRYNVAPTDMHWVVKMREGGGRELAQAKWGLVPRWAKDSKEAFRTINARAETIRSKPAFKAPFVNQRCVVPADGFYEWTGPKSDRRPYWIHKPDGGLLRFAGLWEDWLDRQTGEVVRSFTIVTKDSTGEIADLHDRMPVMLPESEVDRWLSAPADEIGDPREIPTEEGELALRKVSKHVNTPRNDDPECIEPTED